MQRRAFLSLPLAAIPCVAANGFTDELWRSIAGVYAKTLQHPFLKGLSDGTLPRSRFQFYLVQDALYLNAYSKALGMLASKAPKQEWAIMFLKDGIEALEVERAMHGEILSSYGIKDQQILNSDLAPVNYAYTNHLLLSTSRDGFAEGLAAMLPCYWIYLEVGKELTKKGSPNKDYQRWINQYSGDTYAKTVQRVLGVMDECALRISAAERQHAKALFEKSARYEYQFWDMAWREERWLP